VETVLEENQVVLSFDGFEHTRTEQGKKG
jgi:hypothetical protein